MAEITKITVPMMPKESTGAKYKPVTDQAFDLTDPAKIHKAGQDSKLKDQSGAAAANESMNKSLFAPVLKGSSELTIAFNKMVSMLQMGISTSAVLNNPEMRELLEAIYIGKEDLLASLIEQNQGSVLFKGEAFDVLRDIMQRFSEYPRLQNTMSAMLRSFDHGVNAENSVRSILQNCYNLLGFMFTRDRGQFESYLDGLTNLMLPQEGEAISAEEASHMLKNNLLPLLGEIVVKYNHNESIRNFVMTVVHNIVRVDQGTQETLKRSIADFVAELKQLAKVPLRFEENLTSALMAAVKSGNHPKNDFIDKATSIISEVLRSPETTPATLRQAETLLISLLQNQSALMEVLHFVLPLRLADGSLVTAEVYVDPDSKEKNSRNNTSEQPARKIFVSFDSQAHGSFEMSFLQSDKYIDFAIWCPAHLVADIRAIKRSISDIAQANGYIISGYYAEELVAHSSVAQVFPNLLKQKVGIDVKI